MRLSLSHRRLRCLLLLLMLRWWWRRLLLHKRIHCMLGRMLPQRYTNANIYATHWWPIWRWWRWWTIVGWRHGTHRRSRRSWLQCLIGLRWQLLEGAWWRWLERWRWLVSGWCRMYYACWWQ